MPKSPSKNKEKANGAAAAKNGSTVAATNGTPKEGGATNGNHAKLSRSVAVDTVAAATEQDVLQMLERASMVSADREAGLVAAQLELQVAERWAKHAMTEFRAQLDTKDKELEALKTTAQQATEADTKSGELRAEVARLQDELAASQVQAKDQKGELTQAQAEVSELQEEVARLKRELTESQAKASTEADETQDACSKLREEVTALKAELAERKVEVQDLTDKLEQQQQRQEQRPTAADIASSPSSKSKAEAEELKRKADEFRVALNKSQDELRKVRESAATATKESTANKKEVTDLKAQLDATYKELAITKRVATDREADSLKKGKELMQQTSELDGLRQRTKAAEKELGQCKDRLAKALESANAESDEDDEAVPQRAAPRKNGKAVEKRAHGSEEVEASELVASQGSGVDAGGRDIAAANTSPTAKVNGRPAKGGHNGARHQKLSKDARRAAAKEGGLKESLGQVQVFTWAFAAVVLAQVCYLSSWYLSAK